MPESRLSTLAFVDGVDDSYYQSHKLRNEVGSRPIVTRKNFP